MPHQLSLLPPQGGIFFDEPSHTYWVWSDRRDRWMRIASCSQVLSTAGAKGFDPTFWRRNLMDKRGLIRREADLYMDLHRDGRATIGTELHALIRHELLGGAPPMVRNAESLLLLAVWRRDFLPQIEEVIACEQPQASRELFFAGTPDLIAKIGGLWLIVDWKSKVSEAKAKGDPIWPRQLAGYDLLTTENYGVQLDGAMNLMIWPDGCRDVFYNAEDMARLKKQYIGHVAWCHKVNAQKGDEDSRGALEHLLGLHADALQWAKPPKSMSNQQKTEVDASA